MARKVLTEGGYTFTASTRTVLINKYIPRENLILITLEFIIRHWVNYCQF
jgi:hypothetical protein